MKSEAPRHLKAASAAQGRNRRQKASEGKGAKGRARGQHTVEKVCTMYATLDSKWRRHGRDTEAGPRLPPRRP